MMAPIIMAMPLLPHLVIASAKGHPVLAPVHPRSTNGGGKVMTTMMARRRKRNMAPPLAAVEVRVEVPGGRVKIRREIGTMIGRRMRRKGRRMMRRRRNQLSHPSLIF